MTTQQSLGFKFNDQQKKKALADIEGFYLETFDEEASRLKQEQILDFVEETLAPVIYNKALDDALRWFSEQMENLSIDYTLLYRDL